MRSAHAADSKEQGVTGNLKRHINSKLAKASSYSAMLVEILQHEESKARVEDVIEAKAHYTSMRGAAEFERHRWEACLRWYSLTRIIYTALIDAKKFSQVEPVSELLSGTIDPNIRYVAHQMKIPRTTSIESIVKRFAKSQDDPQIQAFLEETAPSKNDSSTLSSGEALQVPKDITWRKRTVLLEDASVAQALATSRAAGHKLSKFLSGETVSLGKRAAAYDEVLIAAQDAVDATKTAIEELTSEGVPQHDRRMQGLQITRTAVNFEMIGWRIGRNRVLCGPQDGSLLEPQYLNRSRTRKRKQPSTADTKPKETKRSFKAISETRPRLLRKLRERTVLYDGIVQSFDSIKELPGVAADSDLISEMECKRSYFVALRCLAIARGHHLVDHSKEALALISKAKELSSAVAEHPSLKNKINEGSEFTAPTLNVTVGEASSLSSLLASLTLRHRALLEMNNIEEENLKRAPQAQRPLIECLNQWPKSGKADLENLVKYPPVMECVPVKPIFLDLAWNYVQYPGAKGKGAGGTSEVATAKEEKKSRGWFGFGR